MRVYGSGTALLTNRKREQRVLRLLSSQGLGGGCIETADDGHVAEWVPGRALSRNEMETPETSERIAATLARLHALRLPEDGDAGTSVLQASTLGTRGTLRRWIEVARRVATEADARALLDTVSDRAEQLAEAVEECTCRSDAPMQWAFGLRAMCHNDATVGNLLIDDMTGNISLIDYEHAGENAVAFDIGNHFCQLMRAPQFAAAHYPALGIRTTFVEAYLHAREAARQEGGDDAPRREWKAAAV